MAGTQASPAAPPAPPSISPTWALKACRVAESAMAAPWMGSGGAYPRGAGAGAALAVATAHSANWLAAAARDPNAAERLASGTQLTQAATEALHRVRWVQKAAVDAGLPPTAAGALDTEWARRAAAAGRTAHALARSMGMNNTAPYADGTTQDSFQQGPESVPAVTMPDALEILSNGSATLGAFSTTPSQTNSLHPSVCSHRINTRPHSRTGLQHLRATKFSTTEAEIKAQAARGALARRRVRKMPGVVERIRSTLWRVTKTRAVAAFAAVSLGLMILLSKSPMVSPIASWGHSELAQDLETFEELLLVPKMRAIVIRAMRTDPDIDHALRFMGTARFRRRCLTIAAMPELQQMSQRLAADGLGLRTTLLTFIEQVEYAYSRVKTKMKQQNKAKGVGLTQSSNGTKGGETKNAENPGSLRPLWNEIKDALPATQIQGLYKIKISQSPPFQRFVEYLSGAEGQVIFRKIRSFKEYATVARTLKKRDVGINEIIKYGHWLFTGNKEMPSHPPNVTHNNKNQTSQTPD